MPFQMKIQPIESETSNGSIRNDSTKPVVKSRIKRLFERQFPNVLRISPAEKLGLGETKSSKDAGGGDFEPSSVILAKMVQNFMEENNEKSSSTITAETKWNRNRCNCFNGNGTDSSDDESEFCCDFSDSIRSSSSGSDVYEILKSLVPCPSISERNLLADTAKIVEKNKNCKRKEDFRKIVTDGLLILGYDASICKSRWEKSSSYPAGEYEYIDVIIDGDRLLIDIDFRSEFEIARSTKNYRSMLQFLPSIFVGKTDRLQQIISIVSESAKQSLKKKGMHLPPWRKSDYIRAKWLSPYSRTISISSSSIKPIESDSEIETKSKIDNQSNSCLIKTENLSGEFDLIMEEKEEKEVNLGESDSVDSAKENPSNETENIKVVVLPWKPPAIKPKNTQKNGKIVTGLASVLK